PFHLKTPDGRILSAPLLQLRRNRRMPPISPRLLAKGFSRSVFPDRLLMIARSASVMETLPPCFYVKKPPVSLSVRDTNHLPQLKELSALLTPLIKRAKFLCG